MENIIHADTGNKYKITPLCDIIVPSPGHSFIFTDINSIDHCINRAREYITCPICLAKLRQIIGRQID